MKYTRYGTVGLATFQALGVAIALESQSAGGLQVVLAPGLGFRITTVVTLVTGTVFLMWLGEQISERGIGNGISIIIFSGIVAGLLTQPHHERVPDPDLDSRVVRCLCIDAFQSSDSLRLRRVLSPKYVPAPWRNASLMSSTSRRFTPRSSSVIASNA